MSVPFRRTCCNSPPTARVMRDETHKHYAKRLLMIGMSLLPVRFVGMAYNSGRSSIHRITNELSAQLGTVTTRVDAARDRDRKPEAVDTVSADIEEAERTLANLKQAHGNRLSAAAWTACSGLRIAGRFCLIVACNRRYSLRAARSGQPRNVPSRGSGVLWSACSFASAPADFVI